MSANKKEETFEIKGEDLLKKIKELIKETLLVIPLTVGVIGALIAPVLAAVGALAAIITECTISIERR
ncbi:hypothetical protein ES703_59696 [subsurface metagenome]